MELFKRNFSEKTNEALRKYNILHVSERQLETFVEYEEGLTVVEFYVERQGAASVMQYTTFGICNEDGDLVCFGDEFASLEPYIQEIKQYGKNFVVKHYSGGKTDRTYVTVDPKTNHLTVVAQHGVGLTHTNTPDVGIGNNGRLYSFKKKCYTTRAYSNIEELEPGIFWVTDKISSTIKDGYTDYFCFAIDQDDYQITNIYSHLENGKYKIEECRDMPYDEIKNMRIAELDEATLREQEQINYTKAYIFRGE